MNKKNIIRVVVVLIIFAIGFWGGMEYKAYQIRSAITEGLKGITGIMDGKSTAEVQAPVEDFTAQNKLREKLDLVVLSKEFQEIDVRNDIMQNANNLHLKFTNKTTKDIRGAEGVMIFYDIFDKEIKRVHVIYDDTPILANTDKTWVATIKYNQFMDDDIKLRNTDLSNIKYVWLPSTIIYQDGTSDKA